MQISVVKRSGLKEPLQIDKWQAQVAKVCQGIADVSQSMIEIKAQLHFYDGITTTEIDGITLRAIVDLIDVDKVAACCEVKSGVIIKRTKDKLPNIIEGINGPLLRTVASIDGSVDVVRTTPQLYTSLQKTSGFKYNKKKYYWLLDGTYKFDNADGTVN